MRILFLLLLCSITGVVDAADQPSRSLSAFLSKYCLDCHGNEKQKGDRRFDELSNQAPTLDNAEALQEILDQLNLANMPPEDAPQPSDNERKELIASLSDSLKTLRTQAQRHPGKVVMRRLNRVEYRNTIRDLFRLKMVDFDPTTTFPVDDSTEGFDNVGEGLVTSDHLLREYLTAARKVADKAILPGPRPAMINYQTGVVASEPGTELATGVAQADKDGRREAGRMFIKFRQPLGFPVLDKKRGVPASGEYVIRFTAKAVRRKSRYKDEDLRYNSSEPMRLSISIDSRELGATAHRIVAEYEIPDDRAIEIEHRLWLEKGFTFHLHWANGPDGSFKRILRKVLPKYNKDALYPVRNPPEMYVGSGPELHVHALQIEGPFFAQWPPKGFARFFPSPPRSPDKTYLRDSLLRFANAAFRRPVDQAELAPYVDLAEAHWAQHGDFWEAAKYGVRAILTSPKFLYLAETVPDDPTNRRLTSHELASRLSYFLWSSMPDDQLRLAADNGELLKPQELRRQVERMLADPKAASFTENFTGQWLGLRKLGEMPPDPEQNPAYYQDDLESAMRNETKLFFSHILNENRSVLEFVDSDYTFLNAALAKHYGIGNVINHDFERVALPPTARRGGLLGQGSILTATSNGIETQPVARGIWVLENLLGTPPNPPPPDIDPLEPDTRGVTTIRELMEKHRNTPTCNECHRKIDPFGLALENFDHVGAWREQYRKRLPIDPTGYMADGSSIDGADGIRAYLMQRPDQFSRCLTEKLFVYALGRRLSFADRDDIDRIVQELPAHRFGFRELIHQIVASEAFQQK